MIRTTPLSSELEAEFRPNPDSEHSVSDSQMGDYDSAVVSHGGGSWPIENPIQGNRQLSVRVSSLSARAFVSASAGEDPPNSISSKHAPTSYT